MVIDLLILAPVVIFLLWLYGYSAPSGRPTRDRWLDRATAAAAVVGGVGTLLGLHALLDVDGLARNVIAVAAAYLVFLTLLSLGWLRRWYASPHSS
ncbi:MAG: hypothetical protein HND55_09225 [Pseudomonadota bacterium]|nr:MAG: hypothetical protein HND55_09225 [Pseudomonadota bacterium]